MIKAVFFDWFHTLARFEPPRENIHSQAYGESGFKIPPQKLVRGLLIADKDWFEETNRLSIDRRTPAEQVELALRYQETALTETGINVPRDQHLKVLKRIQELYQGLRFVLYDDVLSTLKALKDRRLVLGLLTNAKKDMVSLQPLGLESYLDFVVTSAEVGANKPEPPIFRAALEKAGVTAAEAAHVGDQYYLDVVGARRVGIKPILIDRYNFYQEVNDCPLIRTLPQLISYLDVAL